MDEKPKLHYSTTFWSRAPGHNPYQIMVIDHSSIWRAWWLMTKLIWRARRELNTLQGLQGKEDPTQLPSGEQPSVSAE